jgi:hypothetical protein
MNITPIPATERETRMRVARVKLTAARQRRNKAEAKFDMRPSPDNLTLLRIAQMELLTLEHEMLGLELTVPAGILPEGWTEKRQTLKPVLPRRVKVGSSILTAKADLERLDLILPGKTTRDYHDLFAWIDEGLKFA